MAKKKNSKPIVYPVVFMVILTIVFGGALAWINEITKETIATQEALKLKENVLFVLGIQVPSSQPQIEGEEPEPPTAEAIEATYDESVTVRQLKDISIYEGKRDGQIIGYAFLVNGPGLWGSMTGYAAVSADLKSILGMSVVTHSETPGLGGRIDELWFKEQFRNIPIPESTTVDTQVVVFKPKAGGNIDAIAGATLTSESVRVMINQDVANFVANYGGDL